MKFFCFTALALIAAAPFAALAQQDAKGDYLGQSWVGLLTSSDCTSGGTASKEADRAADLTTSGRTTTPPVDASGTRGSSTAHDVANEVTNRDSVPRIGDVRSDTKEVYKDPDWKVAKKQAASLKDSCGVTSGTKSFALVLLDGKILRFDELANSAIAKQVQSRADDSKKPVLLRVRVTGKLQRGQIALNSIQM